MAAWAISAKKKLVILKLLVRKWEKVTEGKSSSARLVKTTQEGKPVKKNRENAFFMDSFYMAGQKPHGWRNLNKIIPFHANGAEL